MDVDGIRIACPACGSRLVAMPRVKYLACAHCGSEYLVQRRGNTVGLEPFEPEQFAISQEIAEVERTQNVGCSNVFFWIFAVTAVFFCGFGYLSRTLFDSSVPMIVGWVISVVSLVVAAGVMLQMLNTERAKRLKLEARRQELYEQRGAEEQEAEADGIQP
jgi:DNA-directed RNA polymerase subunit RPC12/RpoP